MSEGWAAFIADHHGEETGAERAVRLAREAEHRDDRQAERTEAERRAAADERRELMEVAALRSGIAARSVADVFADAGRLGDEDAEYNEALRTIERIDRRRTARQRDQLARAERMAEVGQLASRSATITGGPDLLAPAREAHRQFVAATRSKMAQAVGAPRSRVPFGSAGDARRSEPVTCPMCLKYGATAAQSFLIHQDPSPEPVPAVPSEDEREWLDSRQGAERRTPMIYQGAVISR
jgi:hypothetical protein